MQEISGEMLIGGTAVHGEEGVQRAFNPSTNTEIPEPVFGLGGRESVERAAMLAAKAFDEYRNQPLETRARLLEAIAENIESLGDALIDRAQLESGLTRGRLVGERARTVGQLRLFAKVVRNGDFLRVTIDSALPEREPVARPDLRMMKVPLGPVAVFGASNFPLAFSVAGGDTASALAAGAPVIVKAHSAHLGTSEMVGRAIQNAVKDLSLPEGVFSLLIGAGRKVGEALVEHPVIKAVGFTGSRQGGLALIRIANARKEPIPVYAEMSSINPVFLFPGALAARPESIGRAFADSLTLGAGQFCTNPGLVLAIEGEDLERFVASTRDALAGKDAQTMLTPGICEAYRSSALKCTSATGMQKVAHGKEAGDAPNAAEAALFMTDMQTFLANEDLESEMFGPAAIIVKVKSTDDFQVVAEHLEGQLTGTLQVDAADHAAATPLLRVLERKVGRILVNGYPTGVEVCHAMVHGGPFPSSSNAMFTSVGASSIDRFLRPVCYQDLPDEMLPPALRQANPLGIWRLIDGAVRRRDE